MIEGKVTGSGAPLLVRVPAFREGMTRAIGRLMLSLVRRVKLKLSDDVLHVRSGRLRRSINGRMIGQNTEQPRAFVGTNVPYGRVHEFGGDVTVKEHLRLVKQAFGKQLKHPVWQTVKTHTVRYPERSFLRSALGEMREEVKVELARALKGGRK